MSDPKVMDGIKALTYIAVILTMVFPAGWYFGKSSVLGGHNICDVPMTAIAMPHMKNAAATGKKKFPSVSEWLEEIGKDIPDGQAEAMALALGMERGIDRWVYRNESKGPENIGQVFFLSIEDAHYPTKPEYSLKRFFHDPINEKTIRGIITHQWFKEHGVELGPGKVHQDQGEMIYFPAILKGLKGMAQKGGAQTH